MNEAENQKGIRELMPALSNKIYFNYGGQGPLPTPSLEAITDSWKRIQELGPFTEDIWPFLAKEVNATRQLLAKTCGVQPQRIALTENVTSGCIIPLLGVPFKSGERILISDCEHPGVIAACKEIAKRNELIIDKLPVLELREGINNFKENESKLLDFLDNGLKKNSRLVVISHILWNTGQLIPIAKIAKLLSNHPNQPYLLVDAAQSFGQLAVHDAASQADIYAFTGHKWTFGPEGLGGVALSERILEESIPSIIGWRSLKNENSCNLLEGNQFHKDSRRFEVATSCIPLLAGLRVSLKLLEKEGEASERLTKILCLSSMLWESLKEIKGISPLLKGPPPSGLVSFELSKEIEPQKIVRALGKEGIWIRDLQNPSCLRACVHITSLNNELTTLAKVLKDQLNLKKIFI